MSNSNSKPTQFLLPIFITFFLFLLNKVNSLDDLSFTFKKFVPNQMNLLFQGDASALSNGALRLTKVENDKPIYLSIGRALYLSPVNIWDSATGKVASFTTSFSFVMKAPNPRNIADGLTFFLAPHDSQIPPNSFGPYLRVFSNDSFDPIAVAVEFDTFVNYWDPRGRHIGIDVNNIKSKNTVAWDWRNGEVAIVVINYVASTKTLIVSLSYPSDQTSYAVSALVDLKSILPEWVRVGFSATTGLMKDIAETHEVLSWSFTSTWKNTNHSTIDNDVDVIAQYNA